MTIDDFVAKWKDKYEITIGHFYIENDWTLRIADIDEDEEKKSIYLDKYNLEEFKELIKDFEDNKIQWEKTEKCKGCHKNEN